MPTVADLIIDGLVRAGVPRIFGAAGDTSNLEILYAARRAGLPFVRCHHESAACIMAAVTGELSGCPGIVIAAHGPGLTASVTGLAHAWLDRSPVLFVSERPPDATLRFSSHQRVDHVALLAPIVKGSVTITADSASHWTAHAVRLALAEPRGPVHLDLPADVASEPAVPMATSVVASPCPAPDIDTLERAAAMIAGSKRPVVVAGLQCRPADARWLHAFCEALPAPVLTTPKAKGAIPDPHPLSLGAMTGGALEEPLLARADLVITFGLDPVELPSRRWRYPAPILSFARASSGHPTAGSAHVAPALELVGDLGAILEELAPRLVGRYHADWDVGEVDRLRRERLRALEIAVPGLAPHRVVQLAREFTPAGAIAALDPGAQMSAVIESWQAVALGELLVSNGLKASGFALPAAIAAQLVHAEHRVLCFTSDHSLMMVLSELETAARLALPVVIIVFTSMGDVESGARALARAMGLKTFAAADEPTFKTALWSALAVPAPSLIAAQVLPRDSATGAI